MPLTIQQQCRSIAIQGAAHEVQLIDQRRFEIAGRGQALDQRITHLLRPLEAAIGTAVAQQHLRSLLSYCNSPQMNAPEAYIQFKPGMITADGDVTIKDTEEFLRNYMHELHAFIARVMTVLPREK